jgi:Flp pilus assembly protein TadG
MTSRGRQKGLATTEFAIAVIILLYLLVIILQFGWLLNTYQMLASTTAATGRFFATRTTSNSPRTETLAYFNKGVAYHSAMATPANLTVVTAVAGVNCTDDADCKTKLSAAAKVVIGQGGKTWEDQRATVTVTWDIKNDPLRVKFVSGFMGVDKLLPDTHVFATSSRVTVEK